MKLSNIAFPRVESISKFLTFYEINKNVRIITYAIVHVSYKLVDYFITL